GVREDGQSVRRGRSAVRSLEAALADGLRAGPRRGGDAMSRVAHSPASPSAIRLHHRHSSTAWILLTLLAATGTATATRTGTGTEEIAIVGGRVITLAGDPIEVGTVVLDGDRIASVGPGREAPAGARVVDATGMTVTPGLIAADTRLGVTEIDLEAT